LTIPDPTLIDGRFETVAIRKCTDREGGRQPNLQQNLRLYLSRFLRHLALA